MTETRRQTPKFARGTLLFHISTITSLEELGGFLREGRRQGYRYTTEQQRAIDEKRAELMKEKTP